MVHVIVPLSRILDWLSMLVTFEPARFIPLIFENQVDGPSPLLDAYPSCDLIQKMLGAIVLDLMDCIETKPIEVELFQPIECVMYGKLANDMAAFGVVVDCVSPRSFVVVGEGLRSIERQ